MGNFRRFVNNIQQIDQFDIEKVWNKTQISINYDGANVLSFFQKSMYLIEQFCVVFR